MLTEDRPPVQMAGQLIPVFVSRDFIGKYCSAEQPTTSDIEHASVAGACRNATDA